MPTEAHFEHPCRVCGGRGSFGYGVRVLQGKDGEWFCAAHRPKDSLFEFEKAAGCTFMITKRSVK